MPEQDDSPYHAGERAVQARVGVRERADFAGRKMIRDFLPDPHRAFYEQLPFIVVGSLDRQGRPWASVLSGAPGFVYTPDARTLRVRTRWHPDDPLCAAPGRALGVLGIELSTRRRNRANGHVRRVDALGFELAVDQAFGNCPMYIQARTPRRAPLVTPLAPARHEEARLSAAAVDWIRAADTCFIASASSAELANGDLREGVDVSHRGGNTGFVRVDERDGTTVLTMPDFQGNNAFNTLGNLARYPRAGLSFPDFANGDWLALTGRTEIVWDGDEVAQFRGARRLVRLHVEQGRVLPQQLPFRWSAREPAPQLAQLGSWTGQDDDGTH